MTIRHALTLSTSILAGCFAATQASAAEEQGVVSSDVIIVQARRVSESILDVPISLTVASGEELNERGVRSLEDIALITPNLTTTGGSAASNSFSIRGLSSTSNNPGIESGIGLYVDDVYIGKSFAFMTALSDIERVEVLRGPQGTLYGRNTVGGAINVFTREPGDTATAGGDITYGNYDYVQARADVSGPISQGALYGALSGIIRKRDGVLKDFARDKSYRDLDVWGLRGKLRAELGEATSVTVIGDVYRDNSVDGLEDIKEGALAPLDPFPLDDRKIGTNFNSFSHREATGISARLAHDFGGAELVAVTAYREQRVDALIDQDFSVADISFTGRRQHQSQFSQELRLSFDAGESLGFVIGGYYLSENVAARTTANLGMDAIGTSETALTDARIGTEAVAGFGSAEIRFADNLVATIGLRYSHESKDLRFAQSLSPGAFMPIAGIAVEVPEMTDSYSQGALTGDATLTYRPSNETMLYASYRRGFKAGGFNATLVATVPDTLDFKAEFVDNYEIGGRANLLDGALRFSGAVFYLDYSDKQEQTRVGTFFQVSNAASASARGFEFELTGRPAQWLQIMGGIGYVDAEYDSYPNCDPFGSNCSGNALQNAPKLTLNGAVRVEKEVGTDLSIVALTQVSHTSNAYIYVDNSPAFRQEAKTLVNARIGIGAVDDAWRLSAWANNLLNSHAIEYSQAFLGTTSAYVTTPRTFGLTLSARY
ncbi:TonB-dependent receptor [Sphingosinicella soli]|uniref:Iron complex outermembrane receptor protein n=1 Tax=Sphingosinicella soli TaxID=333708 RepID=A0A7W7B391_9SPHN|nr:TonB-dependent receptor [Sphingosinicella soli]MBB4633151.1 iron complex outermembrane receptor protein [Sphingosinicella soli]